MSKLKEALMAKIEAAERDEALEGLSRWSSVMDVAHAVVFEVKTTGESKTLDELYAKIKELHAQ
jgi:hypothetical protein